MCVCVCIQNPFSRQDHAVRVWTRAPERAAPAEVAQAFDRGVIEGQTKAKKVRFVQRVCLCVCVVSLYIEGKERRNMYIYICIYQ